MEKELREQFRKEFAAECERFHREGHKCATCERGSEKPITGPLLKEASGSIAGTAIPLIDEYWDAFAARVQELLREK